MKPSTRSQLLKTTRRQIRLRNSQYMQTKYKKVLKPLYHRLWDGFLSAATSVTKRKHASKHIETMSNYSMTTNKPYMFQHQKKSGYILGPYTPNRYAS